MVSTAAASRIRKQVADSVAAGAKAEIPVGTFPLDKIGTTFVGPQVITNVNHSMSICILIAILISGIMRDETFGPIVGVMKVSSDEEAIELMNDSEFGLTGSIWTKDLDGKAEKLADQVEAGTVFINRYISPFFSLIQIRLSRSRSCLDGGKEFRTGVHFVQVWL